MHEGMGWRIRKTARQLWALSDALTLRHGDTERQPLRRKDADRHPITRAELQRFLDGLASTVRDCADVSSIILLFFEAGARRALHDNAPSPFVDVRVVRNQSGNVAHCVVEACGARDDAERRRKTKSLNEASAAREQPLNSLLAVVDDSDDASSASSSSSSSASASTSTSASSDPQALASEAVDIFIKMLRAVRFSSAVPSSSASADTRAKSRAAYLEFDDMAMLEDGWFDQPNWADLLRLCNVVAHTSAAWDFRRAAERLSRAEFTDEQLGQHDYLLSALLNVHNASVAHALLAGLPFPRRGDNCWQETSSHWMFQHHWIRYRVGGAVLSVNDLSHHLLRARSGAIFRCGERGQPVTPQASHHHNHNAQQQLQSRRRPCRCGRRRSRPCGTHCG